MKKPIQTKYVAIIVALLIVAVAGWLFYQNQNSQSSSNTPAGHRANTTGAKRPATKATAQSVANSTNPDKSGSAVAPAVLQAPTGQFVSNHRLSLSATGANAQESSVCTTVPGAECSISFTKDGVTHALRRQTADANGNVYWTWRAADLDLKTGSWQITAIATQAGQTKTANDSLNLEVSP